MTPPPLILLVDDYEDTRELYSLFLQMHGYRVEQAEDGLDAIEKVARLPPDAILMDLAMPRLDGWAATERLKRSEATAHIPIICLTAHVQPTHVERALAAGCDGYLCKPCLPSHLAEEIARVLGPRASGSEV